MSKALPSWIESIRGKYLRGEANMFILHMNVYDRFLWDGKLLNLTEFLSKALLEDTKERILVYDPSEGARFTKGSPVRTVESNALGKRNPAEVLPFIEDLLYTANSTGVLIPYTAMIAPDGPMNFMSMVDRVNVTSLHRWSLHSYLSRKDNIIFLITETLRSLNSMLVSNPRIAAVQVPYPDLEDRRRTILHADKSIPAKDAERLATHTAGLQNVQIASLLRPEDVSSFDDQERKAYILSLLGKSKDAQSRADKLAAITRGMDKEEIHHLIDPEAIVESGKNEPDPYAGVLQLLTTRKREIIEKECQGLIEFIDAKHDFSVVGGKDEIKGELLQIAGHIKQGETNMVPMGLLFVGPMGTGKTFIAGAFAKEAGITAIKLKNFRSKYVGETESNLEKVLNLIEVMGPIILIIDEGDRSFGGDTDDEVTSRVIARLKEFMSDTSNRGNVLFIVMTNRPDKLDIDIKRAGRLDKKIPFFYPTTEEEIEHILEAQFRRYKIEHSIQWKDKRSETSSRLKDYSLADLEAVVLLANTMAKRNGKKVDVGIFSTAITDYLPSRDLDMLHYMELLAVFEASSRNMLPKKYRDMSAEDLNHQLQNMRAKLGIRE